MARARIRRMSVLRMGEHRRGADPESARPTCGYPGAFGGSSDAKEAAIHPNEHTRSRPRLPRAVDSTAPKRRARTSRRRRSPPRTRPVGRVRVHRVGAAGSAHRPVPIGRAEGRGWCGPRPCGSSGRWARGRGGSGEVSVTSVSTIADCRPSRGVRAAWSTALASGSAAGRGVRCGRRGRGFGRRATPPGPPKAPPPRATVAAGGAGMSTVCGEADGVDRLPRVAVTAAGRRTHRPARRELRRHTHRPCSSGPWHGVAYRSWQGRSGRGDECGPGSVLGPGRPVRPGAGRR